MRRSYRGTEKTKSRLHFCLWIVKRRIWLYGRFVRFRGLERFRGFEGFGRAARKDSGNFTPRAHSKRFQSTGLNAVSSRADYSLPFYTFQKPFASSSLFRSFLDLVLWRSLQAKKPVGNLFTLRALECFPRMLFLDTCTNAFSRLLDCSTARTLAFLLLPHARYSLKLSSHTPARFNLVALEKFENSNFFELL